MFNLKRNFITKVLRALGYSLSITLGLYIAATEMSANLGLQGFLIFTFLVIGLYLAELFITWKQKTSNIELNFKFDDNFNELSFALHGIVIPITYFCSLIAFGYFNSKNIAFYTLLTLGFFSFIILFLNINYLFDHKLKEESKTHYVYDFITFLIFFNFTNFLLNIANSIDTKVVAVIAVGILGFCLQAIILWRYEKMHRQFLGLGSIAAIAFSLATLFFINSFNPLKLSLILIFVFYVSIAIIHHVIFKTLNRQVIFEYVLISLIILSVMFGLA